MRRVAKTPECGQGSGLVVSLRVSIHMAFNPGFGSRSCAVRPVRAIGSFWGVENEDMFRQGLQNPLLVSGLRVARFRVPHGFTGSGLQIWVFKAWV